MFKCAIAICFLLPAAAFAADAPKSQSCGKTVEECQRVADTLNDEKADLQLAYQFVRRQRDAAQQQLNDTPINTAIQQQQAARQKK
jgi:hypothetical protein